MTTYQLSANTAEVSEHGYMVRYSLIDGPKEGQYGLCEVTNADQLRNEVKLHGIHFLIANPELVACQAHARPTHRHVRGGKDANFAMVTREEADFHAEAMKMTT